MTRSEDGVFHVLLTGFGPFRHYTENPSWLAIKSLHDTTLSISPSALSSSNASSSTLASTNHSDALPTSAPLTIKISTLQIPMEYASVLDIVPGLHLRPPQLPSDNITPPPASYDFIFHIGVAGRGPLRMEKMAHKLGYQMKDALGRMAPVVRERREAEDVNVQLGPGSHGVGIPVLGGIGGGGLGGGLIEGGERLSFDMVDSGRPNRGFGVGYEKFPDELYTDIDILRLVHDLRISGFTEIYTSMDAGHYLSDFIYYLSLAESKRNSKPYEKDSNTQVLFVHVPPCGQPLSADDCTEAIRRIVIWVCSELAMLERERERGLA